MKKKESSAFNKITSKGVDFFQGKIIINGRLSKLKEVYVVIDKIFYLNFIFEN